MNKEITLKSNCIATIIPAGEEVTLAEGATFTIAQSLGNSVTLRDSNGMYRVGEDQLSSLGDEIKQQVLQADQSEEAEGPFDEKQVWDAMRGCYDPEIPVDIVELGLIYRCELSRRDDNQVDVAIDMTLTAPGCGMGDFLVNDVRSKVQALPVVGDVTVNLVFDPPWRQDMMSESAQLAVGFF